MINNLLHLHNSVLEHHHWLFYLNLFVDDLLNPFYDWLLNILSLNFYYFLNNWNLYETLDYFFYFYSLNNRFFNCSFNHFHRFLHNGLLANYFNLYWLFYDISDFNNFLDDLWHFYYSIFHFYDRHYFLYYSINWHLLYHNLMFNGGSWVIDWLFNNDLSNLLDFHYLWHLSNNLLHFLNDDFHWFQNLNGFFGWNDFLPFDNNFFVFRHFYHHFFLHFFNHFYFYYFLDYLLYLDYFRHFLDNFNNVFDDFGHLNDFLNNLRDFNQFFNVNCFDFGNFQRHISHILNNINFFNLNRHFHSIFNWNQLWDFHDLLHYLLNNFFHFNDLRHSSINLQNIINIDHLNDLFLYHSNDSFVDLWHFTCFRHDLFHFCEKSLQQNP